MIDDDSEILNEKRNFVFNNFKKQLLTVVVIGVKTKFWIFFAGKLFI